MILMDINIKAALDGIQLARETLNTYTLHIVFITAHNDTETFQEVLDLSPYGFISKPFSAKDIEVAVQLAYKRFLVYKTDNNKSVQTEVALGNVIISEAYTYSCTEHKLYHKEQFIKLNIKQNKLLEILSKSLNNIVTYDIIISAIWGDEMISDSALRTLVYTLRKNLPDLPIISHSKLGYSLSTNVSYT
jgi:DNA-binding response OmpR family regulator